VKRIYTLLLLVSLLTMIAWSQDRVRIHDLRGTWKFEIGDDVDWAHPDFDDSGWEDVTVPSAWEDQGYPGYDGVAWYRVHFEAPAEWGGKTLFLLLGYIDDVDEVYVNGHFVGFMGQFPPSYVGTDNIPREYHLPVDYLNLSGKNTIAVRVYDHMLAGGIVRGRIGIFEERQVLTPDLSLVGTWLFSEGDDMDWREPSYDDRDWTEVYVPAYWETQGYKGYNGYGWYRKRFRVPRELRREKLILLVGKIDDVDETYLNGQKIGRTGEIPPRGNIFNRPEYTFLRAYTIPPEMLYGDRDNVIAVRVYDGWLHGGIYQGPVGIITRDRYLAWQKEGGDQSKSIFQKLFERILD
jgi:sialate O-acetylesterase